MTRNMRQQEIYRLVQVKGACSIAELARELNVSGETIRRNVKDLVREGLIVKSHGGNSPAEMSVRLDRWRGKQQRRAPYRARRPGQAPIIASKPI